MSRARRWWQLLRRVAGDDAYEQYLQHYAEMNCAEVNCAEVNCADVHCAAPATALGTQPPLDRQAFYLERQRQKWSGVQRCC